MKEEFIHYIWKTKQFSHDKLTTEDGRQLEIIYPGDHNYDSGPDFFNAQIKIDNMIWSGNIEIHINASDWLKHNHQNDEAYNNVILHVVFDSDCKLNANTGKLLSTLEIKDRIDEKMLSGYDYLQNTTNAIPCSDKIKNVPHIVITNWLSRLIAERLERKTNELKIEFEQNKNDWEETFYRHVARQFGMKVNAEPFQWLASALPYKILFRHRDNLLQLEALLFGQSGLLPRDGNDYYTKALNREYNHLQLKYNLYPMPAHQWKFMRLRPNNFPTLRIAQLAGMIYRNPQLFRMCMETNELSVFQNMLSIPASGYWNDHYRFEKSSAPCTKNLGPDAAQNILINTIAPFKFLYGRIKSDEKSEAEAISLLEKMVAESNKIIREWKNLKIHPTCSAESQALLELKKNYCGKKKCLECYIGNYLLEK